MSEPVRLLGIAFVTFPLWGLLTVLIFRLIPDLRWKDFGLSFYAAMVFEWCVFVGLATLFGLLGKDIPNLFQEVTKQAGLIWNAGWLYLVFSLIASLAYLMILFKNNKNDEPADKVLGSLFIIVAPILVFVVWFIVGSVLSVAGAFGA